MPIGNASAIPEECRSSLICIDSYTNQQLLGRFYNASYVEEKPFKNLMQLIFHMETLFETLNCPQAATERRSFQEKTNGLLPRPRYDPRQQPAKPKNLRGEIATFQVWVLFRQHASWQGKVTWLEKNRECKFRSALELFFLMDSTIMLGEKSDMQEPFLTEEEKKRLVI